MYDYYNKTGEESSEPRKGKKIDELVNTTEETPFRHLGIDESGMVIKIWENTKDNAIYLLRGENEKRLPFNDPNLDSGNMVFDTAQVGSQVVHVMDITEQQWLLENQGTMGVIGKAFKAAKTWIPGPLLMSPLGRSMGAGTAAGAKSMKDVIKTGYDLSKIVLKQVIKEQAPNVIHSSVSSHGGGLDYGFTFFADQLVAEALANENYNGVAPDSNYSHWDRQGGFIYFIGTGGDWVFNIPDAGNFMWGMANSYLGTHFVSVLLGSNGNEIFSGGDVPADQQAIIQGYRQWQRVSNPVSDGLGWLFSGLDYKSQQPDFYRTSEEINQVFEQNWEGGQGNRD